MAIVDLMQRAKQIVEGYGLGEKAPIRQAAADAAESISNPTISFDLATGEGARVAAGDVLAIYGATAVTDAHILYVLSVASDTVTAVNGYRGSPLVTADDLDGALFEQLSDGLQSEFMYYKAIETIFGAYLWPEVHKYGTYKITTPDLQYYQNEVPATIIEIERAQQVIADKIEDVPYELKRELSTDVSSTGSIAWVLAFDGTPVWLTTREKYLSSDTLSEELQQLVATGVAAIVLGTTFPETQLERARKDAQDRGERNVANELWRDFVTTRTGMADELARQVDWFEIRR